MAALMDAPTRRSKAKPGGTPGTGRAVTLPGHRATRFERAVARQVEMNEALAVLGRIGFADIGDAFDLAGRLLPLAEIPLSLRPAIASHSIRRTRWTVTYSIRLHPSIHALVALLRHAERETARRVVLRIAPEPPDPASGAGARV